MSKQQRPKGGQGSGDRAPAADVRAGEADRSRAPALAEHQAEGNQALLDQLGPATGPRAADLEEVRAAALPIVERALFALHAEPRPHEVVRKYVEVIESSRLPSDRRAVLVDKLTTDQEAAVQARDAARRFFGGPESEGVQEGLDALDRVWTGLQADRGATVPAEGHVSERAEAWIGELAGPELGPRVQAFCREVYLLLAFDEEEEEEEQGSAVAAEVE